MNNTKNMIRNARGWNAQSSDMKAFMNLSPRNKWPKDGLPPRTIQGFKVWVAPLSDDPADRKSRIHRVRAECPLCLKVMSAGRIHQHVCARTK